jgi:hypothetical protein
MSKNTIAAVLASAQRDAGKSNDLGRWPGVQWAVQVPWHAYSLANTCR